MSEDLSRLPKWARQRIGVLERNVEWWKAKAEKVEAGEASVWMRHGIDEDVPLAGRVETIKFDVADGTSIDVRFDDHLPDGLYVSSSGRNAAGLMILPYSSNVVRIAARRHDEI